MPDFVCPKCLMIIGEFPNEYSIGLLKDDTVELVLNCEECDNEAFHVVIDMAEFEEF